MAARASATFSRSPSHLRPIMAWRRKPSVSGSVTATICITPVSWRRCTRCLTAASDSPTALPIAAYDRRPSTCICSMIRLEISSSTTGATGPPRELWAMGSMLSGYWAMSTDFVDICNHNHGFPCTRHAYLRSSSHRADTLGRLAMTQAPLSNFVNGKHTEPRDGTYSDVVDPSTGEAYARAPLSGAADVDDALNAAAAAFGTWRDATPSERSLAMLRFADAVEKRARELTEAECKNTGKPVGLTLSEELPPSVDQLRFFAAAARLLEGRSAGEYMKDHTSMIRREPVGVCAQVTPWNYPLMMAVWKIGPALAAGNTVVLKPSDTTPASTLLLAEIASEFFPPGVFNVVCGDRDTGRELVKHKIPSMVSITGSVRAGMEVARAAADDLKRVHLELGGKAPVVVFDDADIGATAEGIAGAGYFNAGQDCTAATRVLAGPGIAADLTAALGEQASGTKTGGLDVADAYFGPLNNPNQLT